MATLILPANTAWEAAEAAALAIPAPPLRRPSVAEIAAVAQALTEPGAALLVGGAALYSDLGMVAVRIAAHTGARLMAPFFTARLRRGAGAQHFERLAYEVDQILAIRAGVRRLVLCGAGRPTAFFAYPGKPVFERGARDPGDGSVLGRDGRRLDLAGPGAGGGRCAGCHGGAGPDRAAPRAFDAGQGRCGDGGFAARGYRGGERGRHLGRADYGGLGFSLGK